ncbi:type II toxin-antitoxin system RelE/ParE family toxin [Mesohalobacter halotolerans]|uniref:Type II toxin-antitoxin system RelE/ParE family toxin n=1 Tax=Mesohalobacter halotolerans TaxID=1883405 RepID=A0A4U5TQA0_9FLAO|nr:type II toxin-antitoxin system RelE/ParE family toxin [Mesohalobacter halotolerans]TKS55514.1 type II toxin-antitoxin system RelE/ParE family toxin [Mesohalobacter halotolerans]
MRVVWSELAENELDKIYDYYVKEASIEIAKKIAIGIIKETEKLIKLPLIGQEEELLSHRKFNYRYLIYKNYKIIYHVDLNNKFIKISDVFDTRQNPSKLNRNQ